MSTASTLEGVEYRVVLIDPRSRTVFAVPTSRGYRLMRTSIPQWTRPARQLQKAIQSLGGLQVLILDLIVCGVDGSSSCVIAELLSPPPSWDLARVALKHLLPTELSPPEYATVELVLGDAAESPFSRLGWTEKAARWVEGVTGSKLSSKHNIEQWNAGGAFTLLHFHTEDDRHCWLKATGDSNKHELPVTSLLSKLCGRFLPEFLAAKPEWNAWLTSGETIAISCLPNEPSDSLHLLQDAVESMAELQIMTAGKELELLEAGAFDQRCDALRAHSELVFAYLEEAMSLQISTKAPRVERARLQELRRVFHEICERMAALNLPDTVVHGDLNFGNILTGSGHCQFIDWCETYIGNPLITLQHLLLLNHQSDPQRKKCVDDVLTQTFRSRMLEICDPAAIDHGMVYMPFLAAASALYGRVEWLTRSSRSDPRRQSYARTLARHMDRSARVPALQDLLAV